MLNFNLGTTTDLLTTVRNTHLPEEAQNTSETEAAGPFDKFLRTLRFNKVTAVTVEAGHIYANQAPATEQQEGFAIACKLCTKLSSEGITTRKIVFIDDYNVDRNGFFLEGYLRFATDYGFAPENVFWESHMAEHAKALIDKLSEQGSLESGNGQELLTVKQKIKLRHSDGRFTCAVLDAAFHLERFRQFGYNITVLPTRSEQFPEHDYQKQQRNLRRLLRLLGNDTSPLATVFFEQQRTVNIVY